MVNAIFHSIGFIGGINMDKPVHIGPFRTAAHDRVDDLFFYLLAVISFGKVNELARIFRYSFIGAKGIQHWYIILQVYEMQKAVVDLARLEPNVHGKYQPNLKHHKEQTFKQFYRVSYEEGKLYAQKHTQYNS